jgi:hypothetical protein
MICGAISWRDRFSITVENFPLEIKENNMSFDSRQIIRINISDDWSASDMATFLHELDFLYNLGLRIVAAATSNETERQVEMWTRTLLTEHLKTHHPQAELEVCRIQYNSPGFTDLVGMGTVVGHVKDFLFRLIDYRVHSRRRSLEDDHLAAQNAKINLENDAIRLKNAQLQLENARQFLELAKANGFSDTEIQKLIQPVTGVQETLIRFVADGRIESVELREE